MVILPWRIQEKLLDKIEFMRYFYKKSILNPVMDVLDPAMTLLSLPRLCVIVLPFVFLNIINIFPALGFGIILSTLLLQIAVDTTQNLLADRLLLGHKHG